MKKSKLMGFFKGRFVTIEIKNMRNRLSFGGYLLDEDHEYFYLGERPDGPPHAAIAKSERAGIVAVNELEFLMDQIDVPEDNGVQ